MENNRKIIILAALTIVAAGTAVFWLNIRAPKTGETPVLNPFRTQKTNVDFAKLPESFPANIPIEPGAEIKQNYNAANPDGRFQATRTFVTARNLSENLNLYSDFMKRNGWEIKGTTDNENYKFVAGSKDNESLQISMDENKVTKVRTVEITYTKIDSEAVQSARKTNSALENQRAK